MFSQQDEEVYIVRFFENTKEGRFLDIGAHDGQTFSTTRQLALQGWGGVCVEPSPSVFPALQKRYQNNPKIQTLEYAVSDITGVIDFWDSDGDLVSSINQEHIRAWAAKGWHFKKTQVNTLTVPALFELVGYDFNFINLDVEGTNLNVFSQFPFAKLEKTKMICVEFEHKEQQMLELTKSYGFRLLHKTPENLLLIRH